MKQTFLLLTFLSTLISSAQLKEKFEKGWFINNTDIKIEGYIRADDLSKLSSSICFKRNLHEKECQVYDIEQVQSFQTSNGSIYELLDLKINNQKEDIKIFVNLILKGDQLSLYKGSYKSEFFYVLSKNNKKYVLQNDELIQGETEIKKYNYSGILNFVTEGLAFKNIKKIKFDEDYFAQIVAEYNTIKGVKVKDLRVKEKAKKYILTNAGIGIKNNGSEYYGQAMYRVYEPSISRSTSLNIGISYFNYKFTEQNRDYNQSLFSIPIQMQQNISNKNIRPYIFAGISLNYLQISDENNNSILEEGFQKSYGMNGLFGIGIEIDISENIYLKSEYRNEAYSHPILFGIGYIFKR